MLLRIVLKDVVIYILEINNELCIKLNTKQYSKVIITLLNIINIK